MNTKVYPFIHSLTHSFHSPLLRLSIELTLISRAARTVDLAGAAAAELNKKLSNCH
jgi:hypothetical protein